MYKLKESKTAKAVAGVLGLVTALMMMGPAVASADAVSDLQAQIAALMTQINALNAQVAATTGSGSCAYTFATNLKVGQTGADVMNLQKVLNKSADTQVSVTGAGSPGNETSTFGPATKAAVVKFQNKYTSEILTPAGLTSGTGFVGAGTRAKLNAMCSSTSSTTTTTTTTTTTSGALMVSNTTQPANSLAPGNASRVPFTKFVVTAGASDVTITGVNVERTGLASDSAFTGVVLVDENNAQIGTSKTFNSNHQATIGDTFTVRAGTSKTLTVAGNMTTQTLMGSTYAGQVGSLTVTGINTTGTVSGSFPITGAMHTMNGSLTIGTVSTSTSSFDPGAAQTKNIGDTAIKFSGVRFTAGSGEDLKLYSIRWRQVGSVSSSDIGNLMTNANGTTYPAVIDSTGKYYTTNFAGGITISKGNSIDVYVQGDLIGSGSAGRNADFDIDKVTDVYFVGQLYGYGVAPSGTYTPWYNGNVFTISAGSATSIGKATEVAAQNIAVNLSNQPLGGFVTDFKGEAVSITSLPITIATSTVGGGAITSISLFDQNGAVIAGPVDEASTCTTGCTVTFSDTITFPTGRHIYTIKGKIASGTATNSTVIVTTVPSGWGSPTGQTSGNSVTISQGSFAMNTMTVRAGAMNIALSTTPGSQSIVSSGQGVLFANVQLDASQSGEDVRISAIPFRTSSNTGLSSCQLFDGSTALNTGSNVPTSYSTSAANTLTLDNSLTVTKGTVKTLALKCNLSGGSSTYAVTLNTGDTYTVTGQTSGSTITSTFGNVTSGTMTVTTGTLAVTTDSSSPAYTIATAGSTGVTLGVYKFSASNEAVNLTRIGLSMGTTTTASSTAADLVQVTLWSGATQIGTATFAGTSRTATSTLATALVIPKDGYVTVTAKGDLATQGASQSSHPGALLTIDVDTYGAAGNRNTTGTGFSSGTTIDPAIPTTAAYSTAVSGVRVFRSYPTVARSTTGMSSTLIAQSGSDLYRFAVTANSAGDVALSKLTVNIATSSVSTTNGTTTVTNLKVYAYTGSDFATGPVAGYTAGQVVATVVNLANGNNAATLSSVLTVPAGQTYYFRVVGDVTQVAGTTGSAGSVTTKLSGDTAYPYLAGLMSSSTAVISGIGSTGLFTWSPMSTSTTADNANFDWTNSFNLPGISSGSTDSWTLSK